MKSNEPNLPTRQRHRLTRLGYHFWFVGTFALIGGALRGFNLLLVLAGLVVGILLMHWRWSRRSLERLTVSRRLPSEAFAGQPFRVDYLIKSRSRFLPVWMLRVEEIVSNTLSSDSSDSRWRGLVRKPVSLSKQAVFTKTVCGVGMIPAGQSRPAHVDCNITRRGLYDMGPTSLVSCFPLALLTANKTFVGKSILHVYPKLLPLKRTWSRCLTNSVSGDASSVKRNGGGQGEFFGLREWQSGDSTQLIHWRTTARTGVPSVRQFEQKRSFDLCLLLDGFSNKPGGGKDRNFDDEPDFETAVSLVASIVCQMHRATSNRVVLAVAGAESSVLQSNGQRGGSPRSNLRMLQLLAATEPVESVKLCETIDATLQLAGRSQDTLIVSTRSMAEAIACESQLQEAVSTWNRTSRLRWIDVQSSDLDLFVSSKRSTKTRQRVRS